MDNEVTAPPPTETPKGKALAPIDSLRGGLMAMESQFKMALPPQIPPERFVRVVMTAIQTNKDLVTADRTTLFSACMKSAQDGLLPDGREAALVIFGGKVQYMPMIGGVLKKIRNSGEIASLSPHLVYENDKFSFWIDENGEHLNHQPLMTGDRGDITHVYAIAKTKDGAVYIEVMKKSEVEDVRNVSRAKASGPWVSWYGEMAKKTVLRRLAKRLPLSTDIEQVIRRDDDMFDFKSEPRESKADALSEAIRSEP